MDKTHQIFPSGKISNCIPETRTRVGLRILCLLRVIQRAAFRTGWIVRAFAWGRYDPFSTDDDPRSYKCARCDNTLDRLTNVNQRFETFKNEFKIKELMRLLGKLSTTYFEGLRSNSAEGDIQTGKSDTFLLLISDNTFTPGLRVRFHLPSRQVNVTRV